MRVFLLFIGIVFASSILTFIIHWIFKTRRYVKYIPVILAMFLGIYNIYLARTIEHQGFQDIAKVLLAMMFFVSFFAGLITSLVIDFVKPKKL